MLVLSRKHQQSVVIGGSEGDERLVKVAVLEICGARVKLGFEVKKDVPVHRWEVWERLHTNGNGSETLRKFREHNAHGATEDRYDE